MKTVNIIAVYILKMLEGKNRKFLKATWRRHLGLFT